MWNRVHLRHHVDFIHAAAEKPLHFLKKNLSPLAKKVARLFKHHQDNIQIYNLGGLKNPGVDLMGKGRALDKKAYFYERIPIRTENGEIFTYGKHLKKYVEQWKKEIDENKTTDDFQTWMENEAQDPDVAADLKDWTVRYFDDEDRDQTEIQFDENGEIVQIGLDSEDDDLKPLEQGKYIFVLGKVIENDEVVTKLYATPKVMTDKGKTQHSSFLKGGNVKSAGVIEIDENGRIAAIYNESGHYKPSKKEMALMLKHLNKMGYDTSRIYISYPRHFYAQVIRSRFKINIKWAFVNQRADKWYNHTGRKLIN